MQNVGLSARMVRAIRVLIDTYRCLMQNIFEITKAQFGIVLIDTYRCLMQNENY